jgi:hypothetical protein
MVFTDQQFSVFKHKAFDFPQVMRRHAVIVGQANRREPEFAFSSSAAHVDVRRLVSFI